MSVSVRNHSIWSCLTVGHPVAVARSLEFATLTRSRAVGILHGLVVVSAVSVPAVSAAPAASVVEDCEYVEVVVEHANVDEHPAECDYCISQWAAPVDCACLEGKEIRY